MSTQYLDKSNSMKRTFMMATIRVQVTWLGTGQSSTETLEDFEWAGLNTADQIAVPSIADGDILSLKSKRLSIQEGPNGTKIKEYHLYL
jgi:hypothetical protein